MISRLLRPRSSSERSIEDKRRRMWSSLLDERELTATKSAEISSFLRSDDSAISLADIDFAFECLRPHLISLNNNSSTAVSVNLSSSAPNTPSIVSSSSTNVLNTTTLNNSSSNAIATTTTSNTNSPTNNNNNNNGSNTALPSNSLVHAMALLSTLLETQKSAFSDVLLTETARVVKRVLQRDDVACMAAVSVLIQLCAPDASDARGIALFRQDRDLVSLMIHVIAFAVALAPTTGSPADDERISALRQLTVLATGVIRRHVACEISADSLEQLTTAVCSVSDSARDADLLECTLSFFDAFVSAGAPAPGSVRAVLASLCRAVNVDQFASRSWDIARALLSQPQHGHRGIRALCSLLRDPATAGASHVRRGAVFCLGMACWGSRRVSALDVPSAVLLPVFIAALDDDAGASAIVAHEIALAARRLVRKFADSLALEWDLVLELLLRLAPYVEQSKDSASFATVLQDLLSSIEQLQSAGQYIGSPKLWSLVSARFLTLPGGVRAALRLPPEGAATAGESPMSPTVPARNLSLESIGEGDIDSAVLALSPGSPAWPIPLQRVMAECWRSQSSKTRLEAIGVFERLFDVHKYLFEVELVDKLVLPLLEQSIQETDLSVTSRALAFVAPVLSELQSNRFLDGVAVLCAAAIEPSAPTAEQCTGALGLLLTNKFTRPPATHVCAVFEALCSIAKSAPQMPARRAALRQLTRVNANERFRMRLGAAVSPYLRCHVAQAASQSTSTSAAVEILPTDAMMDAFLAPLKDGEQSSGLIELALNGLIGVLQNCYLAFAFDVGRAAVTICDWLDPVSSASPPSNPQHWLAAINALRHLVPHCVSFSAEQQQRVCSVLMRGIAVAPTTALRCACIDAVGQALLELPANNFCDSVTTLLASVIAIPRTTETFLSTLIFCNTLVGVRGVRAAMTVASTDEILRYILHFCDPNKSNVATLAFETLGRWVLAVPVRERAARCYFVIEVIETLTQRGCSLAEAHHELFARYMYSDERPGLYPTPFRSALVGDFGSGTNHDPLLNDHAKHWLFGNAIMSVRIGAAGFVHVQRRSPGGADSYVLQHLPAVGTHRATIPFAPSLKFAPAGSVRVATPTAQWFLDLGSLTADVSAARDAPPPSASTRAIEPSLPQPTTLAPTNKDGATLTASPIPRSLRLPLATAASSLSSSFFVPESSPRGAQFREAAVKTDTPPQPSPLASSSRALRPLPSYDDDDEDEDKELVQIDGAAPKNASSTTVPAAAATAMPIPKANDTAPRSKRDTTDIELMATLMHPAMAILRQYPFLHEQPIELENGPPLWRAIGVLDRTLCVPTHKVGIVYVGPGQRDLEEALRNRAGSSRYNALLHQLGHFERLDDGEPGRHRYTGGLDRNGADGEHALFWHDQLSLIVYHVCTLIPNRDGDTGSTNKLRHIGNDYVNIVFSANDEPFDAAQFRGQFNFATVIVYPKRFGMYKIDVVQRTQARATVTTSSMVVSKHALVQQLRATVIAADEAAAELVDGHRRRQANAEARLLQIKSVFEKRKQQQQQ